MFSCRIKIVCFDLHYCALFATFCYFLYNLLIILSTQRFLQQISCLNILLSLDKGVNLTEFVENGCFSHLRYFLSVFLQWHKVQTSCSPRISGLRCSSQHLSARKEILQGAGCNNWNCCKGRNKSLLLNSNVGPVTVYNVWLFEK